MSEEIEQLIKVNDTYSISRDSNCWTLHTVREGKNPKTKEPTKRTVKTFYGSLRQVCVAILDRSAGKCEEIEEIINMLEWAADGLTKKLK